MNLTIGFHAVESLLKNSPERIKKLLIDGRRHDERLQALLQKAQSAGIPIDYTYKQRLEKLSGKVPHQGVVAECSPRKKLTEQDLEDLLNKLEQPPFLLILDEVQDPHNLGACLRSADAAGVHAVIAPKNNSVDITPVTEKVASGAAETVPFIQVTNLARTMRDLKQHNIWLYGLTDKAESSLYQANLQGAIALVLGAEGAGLRQNTLKQCDVQCSIPMAGSVSSLNVSVATGVCLFEVVRQRSL